MHKVSKEDRTNISPKAIEQFNELYKIRIYIHQEQDTGPLWILQAQWETKCTKKGVMTTLETIQEKINNKILKNDYKLSCELQRQKILASKQKMIDSIYKSYMWKTVKFEVKEYIEWWVEKNKNSNVNVVKNDIKKMIIKSQNEVTGYVRLSEIGGYHENDDCEELMFSLFRWGVQTEKMKAKTKTKTKGVDIQILEMLDRPSKHFKVSQPELPQEYFYYFRNDKGLIMKEENSD